MAEGGYSVDSGRKQKTDECEICFKEGRWSYAKFVCQQCRQKLCPECKHHHLRSMATRSHNVEEILLSFILDSESRQTDTVPLNLGSDAIVPTLCKEHCQEFKFFCIAHRTELCLTCSRMEHTNCKSVITIEAAAKEIYTDCHEAKIIQSVRQLSEHFQRCRTTTEESKRKLTRKKQMTIGSVEQARRSVEAILDRLETDALADIDKIFDEELKALEARIKICDASISALNASLSSFERMLSLPYNKGKFVETNKVTKQVKQYCNMLLDLHHKMYEIDVKFKENGKISDLKGMLENLGKSEVIKTPVACVNSASVPIYTGEMRVKRDGAIRHEFVITAFDVLPDGRKILLDNTAKMQVYDQNNFCLTETILAVPPYKTIPSLAIVSTNEALVSAFSDELLRFTINEDLVAVTKVKDCGFGPIVRYGDQLMAGVKLKDIFHIVVMDEAGSIQKPILKDEDQTLFKLPICLAMDADETLIFVLDLERGCYGITTDGHILFRYQDPEADVYFGLAVGNDCLFLGVRHANKRYHVQQINFSGVREQCRDFLRSYPLKVLNNELVLFTSVKKNNALINFHFLLNRKEDL